MDKNFISLINNLIEEGVLKTPDIIKAFKKIDRKDFVLDFEKNFTYQNIPLPIGHWQTISQPYTVAFMLELLEPRAWDIILDIGSGSGWTTALLGFIVWEKWHVTGLEIIPELVKFWRQNLWKYKNLNANIIQAEEGILWIPENTFDKILVSASAQTFPRELLNQLKPNWRLVIPVENSIFLYQKDKKWQIFPKEFPGFVFVPLI